MLKEIFTQSDEEYLDSLIYRYNEEHGVDLIQAEVESHTKAFTKLLNIDGRSIRMDSLMISSSCKKTVPA